MAPSLNLTSVVETWLSFGRGGNFVEQFRTTLIRLFGAAMALGVNLAVGRYFDRSCYFSFRMLLLLDPLQRTKQQTTQTTAQIFSTHKMVRPPIVGVRTRISRWHGVETSNYPWTPGPDCSLSVLQQYICSNIRIFVAWATILLGTGWKSQYICSNIRCDKRNKVFTPCKVSSPVLFPTRCNTEWQKQQRKFQQKTDPDLVSLEEEGDGGWVICRETDRQKERKRERARERERSGGGDRQHTRTYRPTPNIGMFISCLLWWMNFERLGGKYQHSKSKKRGPYLPGIRWSRAWLLHYRQPHSVDWAPSARLYMYKRQFEFEMQQFLKANFLPRLQIECPPNCI